MNTRPLIIGIAACDLHGGVGFNDRLPWPRLSGDLRRFQRLTMGHVVVMGRKTWESLGRKPLKHRLNIVLTSNPEAYRQYEGRGEGDIVFIDMGDIATYIEICRREKHNIYVIGGARVWRLFLPWMDMFYMTHVVSHFKCDTFIDKAFIKAYLPHVAHASSIVSETGSVVKPMYFYETWTKRAVN